MMLNVTPGAKYSAILGLGGYRPRRVVDNAEICTMIDSSDEWIRTRPGSSSGAGHPTTRPFR